MGTTDTTLVLVELDDLNNISAELGPSSMEVFLSEFEFRVQQFAREHDEIVKIPPNKLCVLLRDVSDSQQIELAAAKLVRLFEEPITVLDQEFKPTARAAFIPPGCDATTTKMQLRIAESGLREARAKKLPYVVRTKLSREYANDDISRLREIEQAFERGEFVMYFQPQAHATFRNVTGAEALMRWHSPQRGVLAPAEFIPYAERSALIRPFTWFALKSAISHCARWPSPLTVAVNVPPCLLQDEELNQVVQDALAIFDLPPARLILEITENSMIENPQKTLATLGGLRDNGVKIAIDDFGTGYSSFAYFRDLQVDELKVDRSFVSEMLTRPRDRDIVKAVIDLAHNFSLQVVAEGVEDEETAVELTALGCDILQGYLIGRPKPVDQFEAEI